MKVITASITGTGKKIGSLSKDGGIIVYEDGSISCVQHELSMGRTINNMEKAEKVAPVEAKEPASPVEQSKKGKKNSVK